MWEAELYHLLIDEVNKTMRIVPDDHPVMQEEYDPNGTEFVFLTNDKDACEFYAMGFVQGSLVPYTMIEE